MKTIGEWAFNICTSLQSVTMGDSVETIGKGAFFKCTSLQSVTIPAKASYTETRQLPLLPLPNHRHPPPLRRNRSPMTPATPPRAAAAVRASPSGLGGVRPIGANAASASFAPAIAAGPADSLEVWWTL